jgi:hypothetical protein
VVRPLRATGLDNGHITLSGAFGVFYSGRLMAHFYDDHGRPVGDMKVAEVTPTDAVALQSEIAPPEKSARVSLHLIDETGTDRGALQEVPVTPGQILR